MLVSRVRRWAGNLQASKSGTFDMLQVYEATDGHRVPKALCGLLRTELRLAEGTEPVKAIVTVFYRARDYLNSEFWEDQIRRLSDVLAEQHLSGGRGVQLMVHHNLPSWTLGLEMGDHRLLAEFDALHVVGNPLQRAAVKPELVDLEAGAPGCDALRDYYNTTHRLCGTGGPSSSSSSSSSSSHPPSTTRPNAHVLTQWSMPRSTNHSADM